MKQSRWGGMALVIGLGFTAGCDAKREASLASAPSDKATAREESADGVTAPVASAVATSSGPSGGSGSLGYAQNGPGRSAPPPSLEAFEGKSKSGASRTPSLVAQPAAMPPSQRDPGSAKPSAWYGAQQEQARARVALDPNARYATTYRPGGAALAAFDAAVAKGSIPGTYKTLVGDFGGRYAPSIEAPTPAALRVVVDTERTVLAPEGGKVNVRIALRSSDKMPARAPLSVHLVLDVSGSMQGPAIENAKSAAQKLVERLDPTDDFSMVTFSSDAEVLVPDGPIGQRRSAVLAKIGNVRADGGTNISAGLDAGYQQAHTKSISPEAVRIVMLLSDGHANGGDTNAGSLAARSERAFQDGIQTSSFGLGADFDGALMGSIADRGAGGYYYLADSTQIAPALAKEMDARLVPAATGVEVRVRLQPDVVASKVYGSRVLSGQEAVAVRTQEIAVDVNTAKKDGIKRDRKDDAEGGMRFFMPAFARDDRHAMLLTFDVPRGAGERAIASIEVKYKDRLQKKNVTEEIRLKTHFGANEAESVASQNASVVATVQAFAAGDTILAAAEALDRGDRAYAAKILQERAELMKQASERLHEGKLAEDGLRLARLAQATSGKEQVGEPLALAMLLRGSGYGYLR